MEDNTEAFTDCWGAQAPRVLAYARRHVGADEAPDVVAETFMIAWRRWHEVPDPPIGWLLRTAAGVIRNRTRSARRRHRLTDRIALLSIAAAAASDAAEAVVQRDEALCRLAALTDDQRETLLLVSWDGLSPDEAAAVLGLGPAAFRKRLSRAREALRDEPPLAPVRATLNRAAAVSQEMS
jgi:RNA polymerase sigma-70 factor (ECF subfamily)